MKKFDEIKKSVVDTKDKTVAFCKAHKEDIKRAGCFAAGVALTVIFEEKRWSTTGFKSATEPLIYPDSGKPGYILRVYNKNHKEIDRFRTCVEFDSPIHGIQIGRSILTMSHIANGDEEKYTWHEKETE